MVFLVKPDTSRTPVPPRRSLTVSDLLSKRYVDAWWGRGCKVAADDQATGKDVPIKDKQ